MLRLGAIAAILLSVALAFACAGGWLSPQRLTQRRLMEAFDGSNGAHPGFRRDHAKGVCVGGWFDATGTAALLSRSVLLQSARVPVIGRFALAGGQPAQPDAAATVRSLALRFLGPDGEWRTGMDDIPVSAVNSAQAFYEQLRAAAPDPATGKPDAGAMQKFLERHPESVRAMALIRERLVSPGFADATYNSLDAFRLVDAGGRATAVRWAAVPLDPPKPAGRRPAVHGGNYLFDELIAQIRLRPLRWRLMFTVGQAEDPTSDATLPWPADRARIDAGTVTLTTISGEDEEGACTNIVFDPLVLPPGIEPSDDPLLSARSAAYARSFTLRIEERRRKPPSAVTPPPAARAAVP